MPSKFDQYLNELSDQDKESLASAKDQIEEAKDANQQTVEQDYQKREGRPLDTNLSGYEKPSEPGSLNEETKTQAKDSLAAYDNTHDKEQDQQQTQEQDHER